MATTVTLTTICAPSDDIVAREIEGEMQNGQGDQDSKEAMAETRAHRPGAEQA